MKRTALALTLVAALLLSAVAGTRLFNYAEANPYLYGGGTSPPEGTVPPMISIVSPGNNTGYASNNISVVFNVTFTYFLTDICYEVDWQEGNTSVYHTNSPYYSGIRGVSEFFYNETLVGIPEGKHSLSIIVMAEGGYVKDQTVYYFNIGSPSSVYFTINSIEPFPTVPVAVASGASAAAIAASLLIYFKRRKH